MINDVNGPDKLRTAVADRLKVNHLGIHLSITLNRINNILYNSCRGGLLMVIISEGGLYTRKGRRGTRGVAGTSDIL